MRRLRLQTALQSKQVAINSQQLVCPWRTDLLSYRHYAVGICAATTPLDLPTDNACDDEDRAASVRGNQVPHKFPRRPLAQDSNSHQGDDWNRALGRRRSLPTRLRPQLPR